MRIVRLLGTTFALLTLCGSARAEEDPISDTARELFQKGMKAYDQQKWDQCRAALLAAFAIKRHSQIAGNLAECEMRLGAYRDAAEHAWFFAHTLRPDASPERRAMAETALKETQQKVGTLTIKVDVDDADVQVDGKSAGKAPLSAPVFVEPGRHAIEALHVGDAGVRTTVDVVAGGTREVTLTLKRKEPPTPTKQAGPKTAVLVTGGAVTGAALVTGVVLAVLAQNRGSAADAALAPLLASNPCQTSACATIDSDRKAHDALAKGTIGAFVGAGAIGVATLAYALLAPRISPQTGIRVVPVVGTNGGGIAVLGAWR